MSRKRVVEANVRIGDRFRIGSTQFVVTQPRLACFKLGIRFGRMDMLKRMLKSGRTGFYFAVTTSPTINHTDQSMTTQEVLDELKVLAKPTIKKVLINHGAREPFFGVSVEDLKKRASRPRGGRRSAAWFRSGATNSWI